jgi:hypothetical protein
VKDKIKEAFAATEADEQPDDQATRDILLLPFAQEFRLFRPDSWPG